jgi:hypothetical protein
MQRWNIVSSSKTRAFNQFSRLHANDFALIIRGEQVDQSCMGFMQAIHCFSSNELNYSNGVKSKEQITICNYTEFNYNCEIKCKVGAHISDF